MLKRLIIAFTLCVVVVGALSVQSTPVMALIDRTVLSLDRADRLVRSYLGLPLRGTPDLSRLDERLDEVGVKLGAPVFVRIFKQEHLLEIWMKKDDRFVLFASYPICRWSGYLGPKLKEGDRQSPEGFYTVSKGQLNPNSRWHRSFNLGFPNIFDRSHKRTGSYLMVHGGCSSIGCYAMTNAAMDEIWRIVTAALWRGQGRFHVHVYPFRMTGWNRRLHRGNRWNSFWTDLQDGHDVFDRTHVPPRISVCRQRYVVREGKDGGKGNDRILTHCPKQPPSAAVEANPRNS